MHRKRKRVLIFFSMGLLYFLGGSGWWTELGRTQKQSKDTAVIRGTVRDQNSPLYGILVKAKADGKNYATSVFTDEQGEYVFPPLPVGSYVVSVGTKWQEKVNLGSSPVRKDFVVELGTGFMNQTSGIRWFDLLPATEVEKKLLFTNCSGCHTLWRLIDRPQSSLEEWAHLIRRMETIRGPYQVDLSEDNFQVLTKYLSDTIKPDLKESRVVEAMIRPRGEGAKAVITEWDLPKEFGSPLGTKVDSKGVIWFTAGSVGALGRLDPRTGEFQTWPAPLGNLKGEGPLLHDLLLDKEENVWITSSGKNKIIHLNTKTFQYTSWDVPSEYGKWPLCGDLDPRGNFWFTMHEGKGWVVKLDPRTGKFTGYPTKTENPGNYGLVVDSKGTVWFTEFDRSKVGKINPQTGELTEYSTPISNAAPRRIQKDSKGNLWFTQSFADKIGKLEPRTMKFTDYDIGAPGVFPYFMRIDKSDQVWFNLVNNNTIGKLDPTTKKISYTLFPAPESGSRDPGFDFTADPPALVYGNLSPAIGRVYFRR